MRKIVFSKEATQMVLILAYELVFWFEKEGHNDVHPKDDGRGREYLPVQFILHLNYTN